MPQDDPVSAIIAVRRPVRRSFDKPIRKGAADKHRPRVRLIMGPAGAGASVGRVILQCESGRQPSEWFFKPV